MGLSSSSCQIRAVTRHFVAPSGPEFDAEAMDLTVDLTGAPDSDDDMDSMEAA